MEVLFLGDFWETMSGYVWMGRTFRWYSSHGSDFNYDFHATVDDRVAPAQIFYRRGRDGEGRMPWTGPWLLTGVLPRTGVAE
jgi:hypothetical protein